jgi:hypothetical protein
MIKQQCFALLTHGLPCLHYAPWTVNAEDAMRHVERAPCWHLKTQVEPFCWQHIISS